MLIVFVCASSTVITRSQRGTAVRHRRPAGLFLWHLMQMYAPGDGIDSSCDPSSNLVEEEPLSSSPTAAAAVLSTDTSFKRNSMRHSLCTDFPHFEHVSSGTGLFLARQYTPALQDVIISKGNSVKRRKTIEKRRTYGFSSLWGCGVITAARTEKNRL